MGIVCAVHEWIYVYGISDFFVWFMPLYLIGKFALFPIPFADRLAAIYLSGVGGETVDVSFIDDTGSEKTVTLTDHGKMHTRKEALYALRSRSDTADEEG